MLEDFGERIRNPRLRRPLLGMGLSYLAWLTALIFAAEAGLAQGGQTERWLAIIVPLIPMLIMVFFMLRLHDNSDEVEYAMHASAARTGFVVMLVVAFFAWQLEEFKLEFRLSAIDIWCAGMLAWLIGLWIAWKRRQ